MEWSGRHSTPTGIEERLRPRRHAEEAQLPPRGKRVSAAQWNELVSLSLTEFRFIRLYIFKSISESFRSSSIFALICCCDFCCSRLPFNVSFTSSNFGVSFDSPLADTSES